MKNKLISVGFGEMSTLMAAADCDSSADSKGKLTTPSDPGIVRDRFGRTIDRFSPLRIAEIEEKRSKQTSRRI